MNTPADTNPYQAPSALVVDSAAAATERAFYVVAPRKFLILMAGTLGIYAVYWFYRNWSQLKRDRRETWWPVPRAIFAIFFTHSLFEYVDVALKRQGLLRDHAWPSSGMATLYIGSALATSILGRLSVLGSPLTDIVSTALIVPMTYALYRAQRAINLAEGDRDGDSNASITIANIAWLAFGGLMWLATLFGLYVMVRGGKI